MVDDVQLTDLEVIQKFGLAVRAATGTPAPAVRRAPTSATAAPTAAPAVRRPRGGA